MTQNHNFGFKPRSRFEAVAQRADEKEGNGDHQPQLCCDSSTTPLRRLVFSEATGLGQPSCSTARTAAASW
jgi:Tfp pilus assembly protein FimT